MRNIEKAPMRRSVLLEQLELNLDAVPQRDGTRCVARTVFSTRFGADGRCLRGNGHGPNGAFCRQHAKRWQDEARQRRKSGAGR